MILNYKKLFNGEWDVTRDGTKKRYVTKVIKITNMNLIKLKINSEYFLLDRNYLHDYIMFYDELFKFHHRRSGNSCHS